MTRTFEAWFKKYVEQCNEKYFKRIEDLEDKLLKAEQKAQKIADIRIKIDLSRRSELDSKVALANEEAFSIHTQIEAANRIKEEMDVSKLKLTAQKVYDKLAKHPKIEKIQISKENDLNIYTKKLKVKNDEIGDFKLTYRLPDMFFVRNLEYIVDGNCDHWHVKYGEPCLASWKPILWKQIDTYQIFLFVDTLIHYLLLSNDTHAYMPYNDWISKFKAKEKITKPAEIIRAELSEGQEMYLAAYSNLQMDTGTDLGIQNSTSSEWEVTTYSHDFSGGAGGSGSGTAGGSGGSTGTNTWQYWGISNGTA